MKNLLTTFINYYPTNQATKDLILSNYMQNLLSGLRVPIYDFLCFTDCSHSADLDSTYEYYVSKGIIFTDCVALLETLRGIANQLRLTDTIYKVTIQDGVCGTETYHCRGMNKVEDLVFDIFTDWNRAEDTIDDIDDHLRESGVGYIKVEEIKLQGE